MYKCTVKTYNLLNSIWQTHATVDLCVSVFSTDMHSSSLGARPSGFLCRHKINNFEYVHELGESTYPEMSHIGGHFFFKLNLLCTKNRSD